MLKRLGRRSSNLTRIRPPRVKGRDQERQTRSGCLKRESSDKTARLGFNDGCGNAACTKHVSRVARGALESYWCPTAVRIKKGGHLEGCLSYFCGSARGRPHIGVLLSCGTRKSGPGCATNQLQGLARTQKAYRAVQLSEQVPAHPVPFSSAVLEESNRVESLLVLEHEIEGATKLLSDDGQRLGLAVLADQLVVVALGGFVVAQEGDRCF